MKINEIEEYLKESFILKMNNGSLIYKKGDNIVVKNAKSHFVLTIKDFYDLYKDADFSLIEKNDSDYDFEKDIEYYGTLIKHK